MIAVPRRTLPVLLLTLTLLLGCGTRESTTPLTLSEAELDWIGEQIFQNECASKEVCLVHWNEGEAFPSLGIGHFIWYPKGVDERFVESFPGLLEFMQAQSAAVPEWLTRLEPVDAPWPDRDAFLARQDTEQVRSLREFLARNKGVQVQYIFARAQSALGKIVEAAPEAERPRIRARLDALSATPGGLYALIDYVNFKGEGLAAGERYAGQGWGLLQVLQAMSDSSGTTALEQFQQAAGVVLTRRAENAANPIERERWLPGWLNRLRTYQEPVG